MKKDFLHEINEKNRTFRFETFTSHTGKLSKGKFKIQSPLEDIGRDWQTKGLLDTQRLISLKQSSQILGNSRNVENFNDERF